MTEYIREEGPSLSAAGEKPIQPAGAVASSPTEEKKQASHGKQDADPLLKWQERLLPLMTRMIIGLTLFFFIASFFQLAYLHWNISQSPQMDILVPLDAMEVNSAASVSEMINVTQLKIIAILEANALERRHHQANVLLMSRVWVRYMGFVTGMVLALVGSTFILGKLQEPTTEVETSSSVLSFALKSTSPGIILAVLGVMLMLTTIIVHHEISVTDVPVYLHETTTSSSTSEEIIQPPRVDPLDLEGTQDLTEQESNAP